MDLKILTNNIEPSALKQIEALKDHPAFINEKVRIQPDCHAGAGCVIGFTSTFTDKIIPQIVGVDIGCGVAAICLGFEKDKYLTNQGLELFDKYLRKNVPSGFSVHNNHPKIELSSENFKSAFISNVDAICEKTKQDNGRVFRSIGTLGGGNHFIELNKDQLGRLWLVVHSGSRNFGLQIATYHQKIAEEKTSLGALSYLEGKDMENYLEDMKVAQEYAALNRKMILDALIPQFFASNEEKKLVDIVSSIHNYINFEDKIIRKGAISAHEGEQVIIPFNMRDGSIIAVGKGNEDWNWSAPHGAGRIMGRGTAKKTLSMNDFKSSMEGIWSSCISEETLDEAPMAYKNKEEVLSLIQDTVTCLAQLTPIYNFKAEEKRKR